MLKTRTPKLRPAAIAICLAAIPITAFSADLQVPVPFVSIQAAINASTSGDTIFVQPGVYVENINLNGKNVTIKPFNNNFDTIIDGNQAGPVVTFSGSETANCSLRNLILRNGKSANGAGIKGNNTFATIKNCTIGANLATGDGGGIYRVSGLITGCQITLNQAANGGGLAQCDGTIENSKITNNKATVKGGGIFDCPGVIQFNQITNNEASTGGGGISDTEAIITANLISGNTVTATGPIATPASFGGGLNDIGGTVTLNTIKSNQSAGDGGGISNSDALFQNNIIYQNNARRGGGIANSLKRIENNTIYNNTAVSSGGGVRNVGTSVTNCIIYGNSAPADAQWSGGTVPTYSCVQNWTGGQPDIVTGDPRFQDPGKGQFNLLPLSSCIDAGRFIADLTLDFQGDPRPFDGTPIPAGDGSDFDIGAYEFTPQNVDLVGTLTGVTTKYKGSIPKLKGSIKGTFLVANTGTDTTEAVAAVQFFLSNDNILDLSDIPVGKTVALKNLKGGKSKKIKCSVKLPPNVTATGQYLFAWADTTDTIAEANELNNLSVAGPLP